jgi:hypothetical protein
VDEKKPFSILIRDVNNLFISCENLLKTETQNKKNENEVILDVKNEKQKE